MKEFNYTESELSRLKVNAPTISFKCSDYDGNETKYLGVNSLGSIKAFRKFLDERETFLKNSEVENDN